MKYINNNAIIIVLLAVLFSSVTHSQFNTPPTSDYTCLFNFYTRLNVIHLLFSANSSSVYDFCVKTNFIICDSTNGYSVTNIVIDNIQASPGVDENDLKCLSNLQIITITATPIGSELIYYTFPKVVRATYTKIPNGLAGGIIKQLPAYISIDFMDCPQLNGTTLNIRYISNTSQFTSDGSHYHYLEVDSYSPPAILKLIFLQINVINVPDLSNYKFNGILILQFNQLVDRNSLGALFNKTTFEQKGILEKPSQVIDLSSNTGLKNLYLKTPNPTFNVGNGIFPLILSIETSINFENLNFTVFPAFSSFRSTQSVVSIKNSISAELPKFTARNANLFYALSGNKLTGTVDESWCSVLVDLSNNLLTGTIPDCFTCYFKDPYYFSSSIGITYNRFSGNQFTNYDVNAPCTFKPFVKLIGYNIDGNSFKNGFRLSGNIGFNPNNWKVMDGQTSKAVLCSQTIVGNYSSYDCYVSLPNKLDYIQMNFTYPYTSLYTFALAEKPSYPKSIQINGNQVSMDGEYFQTLLNYFSQTITVSGTIDCLIYGSNFHSLSCTLASLPLTSTIQLLTITNNDINKRTRVYVNTTYPFVNNKLCPNDCTSDLNGICDMSSSQCICEQGYEGLDCSGISCPSTCLNGGSCDTTIGQCSCSQGYAGSDCSEILCSSTCLNGGSCNTTIGQCLCSEGYTGSDCSGILCTSSCLNGGTCDTTIGKCLCTTDYIGKDCSIPNQFISSCYPSTTQGGNAAIIGKFDNLLSDAIIKIGDQDCPITSISNKIINCTAPAGHGIMNITIIQSGLPTIVGNNMYSYIELYKECPNDCSNHGTCDTSNAQCHCETGYTLNDCSEKVNDNPTPSTNTTVDPNTGGANMSNQNTNFQVYFKSLLELDFNGNIVNQYSLLDGWTYSNSSENSEYQFSFYKSINQETSNCTIISKIEEIVDANGKDYSFAGTTFHLDTNSIKLSIAIINYTYQSNLNTLQLQFLSSVDNEKQSNDCNEKNTEIQQVTNSEFNYIKISKDSKILSGRFINRVISDGVSTFLSSTTIVESNSTTVSLNLPHCVVKCEIDPDFSVIIDADFKSSCDNSRPSWIIPVAVIVPCVSIVLIIISVTLIYRKSSIFREKVIKLKLVALKKN